MLHERAYLKEKKKEKKINKYYKSLEHASFGQMSDHINESKMMDDELFFGDWYIWLLLLLLQF